LFEDLKLEPRHSGSRRLSMTKEISTGRRLIFVPFLFLCQLASAAQAPIDPDVIEKAAETKATVAANGVVRIGWARDDVPVTVDGMRLAPPAGLGTWAAFTAAPEGAVVMGDTVVFQDEVDAAMDAALASGLDVTAVHNHFFFDEPKVYFMHIGGRGEQQRLASAVKSVWNAIRKVRAERPQPATSFEGRAVTSGSIDPATIGKIFELEPSVSEGVVKVSIGHEGAIYGVSVGEPMGLNTWAAFSGTDDHAAVDGDFIMTAQEVQPVLRSLRRSGIHVVALHNHMIGGEPQFYFLHYWGKGRAADLAEAVKAALSAQERMRHDEK
jgi:hypothetical protein